MLARDYEAVGRKGYVEEEWNTGEESGRLKSVGRDCGGGITISDVLNHRVQSLCVRGESGLPSFGSKGRSPGEFMQPCQATLSADSKVVAVADSGNNRVQLFDAATRALLGSTGRKGKIKPGRMQGPEGVTFIDGRREMIVADTGNDRLQVFHVEQLRSAPEAPGFQAPAGNGTSVSVTRLSYSEGSPEHTTMGRRQSAESVSPMSWARTHAPPPYGRPDTAGQEADKVENPGAGGLPVAGGIRPEVVKGKPDDGGRGGGGEGGGEGARSCLLIFNGGENDGNLRRHRTPGEREAAAGPLRQPCDVAYWRARKEGGDVVFAWNPEIPPWFRGRGRDRVNADTQEANIREELLSSPQHALHSNHPRKGSGRSSSATSEINPQLHDFGISIQSSNGRGGVIADDRGPVAGDFVVREAGAGELQLLVVAKIKEAEDGKAEGKTGPMEDEAVSALSGNGSEGTDGSDWMARRERPSFATRESKDAGGRRKTGSGESQNEGDEIMPLKPSSSANVPEFEVRAESITVLGDDEGVEMCGRKYRSLLGLLRVYRARGFNKLTGVADTRGDRGLVAVAERGGGRVRLLHYAPAFPPFYQTELTEVHSINGLRRPSSVSFNREGDLLIVDNGALKVIVYSKLSGVWVRVHEFGPTDDTAQGGAAGNQGIDKDDAEVRPPAVFAGDRHNTKAERNRLACAAGVPPPKAAGGRAASDQTNQGDTEFDDRQTPITMPASNSATESKEYDPDVESNGAAGRDGRRGPFVYTGEGRRGTRDMEKIDWVAGVPVAARFVRFKTGSIGKTADLDKSSVTRSLALVVGTSDGRVRALSGPRRRECGTFSGLHEDTALSIFEILGYGYSQVLCCVNRTTVRLRARLRREWRLHPLTPGSLAKVTLEFLRWGRLATGGGLPGRGADVDASGVKLCDHFLATSKCSRPACPYSHEQPWVGVGFADNEDACILFRGGIVHAITNLYGQIFAWEWEGDLYRLFREMCSAKTIVNRRDPMSLGRFGAEVVRDCVEEEHDVLGYSAFKEFATVLHEHVQGLRSWHRRPGNSRSTDTRPARLPKEPAPVGATAAHGSEGGESKHCCGSNYDVGVGAKADADREGADGAERKANRSEVAVKELTRKGATNLEAPTRRQQYSDCHTRSDLLETCPWLGWDFAHRDVRASRRTSPGGSGLDGDPKAYGKELEEHDEEDEEPKTNRIYGGEEDERASSVNKVISFQTDRVVRALDRLF